MNLESLKILLPVIGLVVAAISSALEIVGSLKTRAAEKSYIDEVVLAIGSQALGAVAVGHFLNARKILNKVPHDEEAIKLTLAAHDEDREKVIHALKNVTDNLSPQKRKVILGALNQASESGRIAYTAKILSQIEALPKPQP